MTGKRTPLQIAHRGGTGLWPENTLEAFERAIDYGAEGIELDVHLTSDDVLVVHHDESLNPAIARDASGEWMTRPTPLLKDLTLADLQAYDVGRLRPASKYAAKFPKQAPIDGARIPSLEAVIELLKERTASSFRLYLELKTSVLDPESAADPQELAQAAAECVRHHAFEERTTFVSFNWEALRTVKQLLPSAKCRFTTFPFAWIDPDHPLAVLDEPGGTSTRLRALSSQGGPWAGGIDWRTQPRGSFDAKILHSIKEAGGNGWFAYFLDVTDENMTLARNLNLAVSVWTVDDPEYIRKMVDLKVEAILTDRPDRLRKIMASNTP
ncbi:MAG: hypothetical protein GY866_24150 [Proteobacteria bacterium]|nr:hypothetical protein [Pseudomonadota bacterium]